MTQFKVGDKVRVLDASAIDCSGQDYYDGMRTEVIAVDHEGDVYLRAQDGSPGIHVDETEFHAIEKITGGDTMNYRTVKRKARVGERILITNAGFSLGHYKNGDVLTVDRTGRLGEYAVELEGIQGGNFHIEEKEYEVIIEEPTQQSHKRVDALEAEIEALKGRIATLEKADKPAVNASQPESSQDFADALSEVARIMANISKKTPNRRRKDTIKRAKAFVEDVKERAVGNNTNADGNFTFNHRTTKLTFHVNAEKRVVTALAHGAGNGKLYGKAFAKCAPDDVFNADIGMAIAAGRLYGLDVGEFVSAVQPTEAVVGMRVDTACSFKTMTIDRSTSIERNLLGADAYESLHRASILDDTEAQY